MAEQSKQDWVWDFGMEAYLTSDDGKPATGHTLILGTTSSGKTTFLTALLSAEPTRPDADPGADREPAQ
ncbi:FtsK/SpoIIIE domain-containing protein [Caballeronia sordidicola]|jgi:polynucleotide 5'-kinase involved in rRNA processing|uniref:FtsK/SpoIIIE domain-containing protein n=1 Tax=Caballeronia sordidicola TaxID=196367 RepID=UPI000A3BCC2C|nr:FtsK/SpoIIIE domain-containing protein [Caballeronia sordidicola]